MTRVVLVIGFVLGPILARVPDDAALRAMRTGLDALGITERELGFHKQWATDSFFRLKTVDRLLDSPLETEGYADSCAGFVERNRDNPPAVFVGQYQAADVPLSGKDTAMLAKEIRHAAKERLGCADALPPAVARAINTVLASFRVGRKYLDQAVRGLSAAELDRLLGEAPDFWADEEDTVDESLRGVLQREFGRDYDTSVDVKAETVLAYARKLDRKALALAGLAVVFGACDARRTLEEPFAFPHEAGLLEVEGIQGGVYFSAQTEWGLVVVGSAHDNVYRRDCCLVIEIGGDDSYHGRVGAGIGVLGPGFGVAIDLAGDDRYLSRRVFSQGAALFGCGVLIDCQGDDVYRGGHYSQGTGVFGTGLLWDLGGRDFYDAGFCCQGAGHFGAGQLSDASGNDSYRSLCYCQGFASTWGCGLLADHDGNDGYYAGGRYRHEPLLPREYRSFAQGFAIGWRPDAAGGIALLYDRHGNDFYDAEVFAQGTSYWYSLGMLWDGDGYDHYTAAQYSQGAGIHLAIGCLVDCRGDDSYYSRLGPSQGEGHDLSVGVLVDRKGNDVYYASGGQGIGLTNSVGLFCDSDGNDCYTTSEKNAGQGWGNTARGFTGIGMFLDLAGADRYAKDNLGYDAQSWTQGTYGAGADLSAERVPGEEAEEGDTLETAADSIALPVDSIFRIASMWEVGNARARVKQARRQLKELGPTALEYVFEKKADTKDGLESRAVEELVKAWPDTAKPFLFRALRDERYLARNNAAYWLGKMGKDASDAVDSVLLALQDERISPRRAAAAFGDIGDSLVVPHILYLLKDGYEPSRIVTAEACAKLKNPAAAPALVAALADPLFTVRSAAELALVSIGEPGLEPLLAGLAGMRTPALGHAIRACGRFRAADTLDTLKQQEVKARVRAAITPYIRHQSPFVRLTAVEALGGPLDGPLRHQIEVARAEEKNQFVLGAFRKALARE